MWVYYLAMLLVIISNVLYHTFLKLTPNNANPFLSLAVTYMTAMLACIILFPIYSPEGESLRSSIKNLNWTSIALGLAIVGLETGFLLAYRAGGNISYTGIFSNVAAMLILLPIGLIFFKEVLTIKNILGIILCLGGLVLIQSK